MNKASKYYFDQAMTKAVMYRVLKDTDDEFVIVTLTKNDTIDGIKYWLFRHNYQFERNITCAHDDFIGEYSSDEREQAEKDFELAASGLLKCNYCGKWIGLEHATRFVPAGVSCPACIAQGAEDQKKFFDLPLD